MIATVPVNTLELPNGPARFAVYVTQNGQEYEAHVEVTIANPVDAAIDVVSRATQWDTTRRTTDNGKPTKLEFDKSTVVRINGTVVP